MLVAQPSSTMACILGVTGTESRQISSRTYTLSDIHREMTWCSSSSWKLCHITIHVPLARQSDSKYTPFGPCIMISANLARSGRQLGTRCRIGQIRCFSSGTMAAEKPISGPSKAPTLVMQIIVRRDLQTVSSTVSFREEADEAGERLAHRPTDGSGRTCSNGRLVSSSRTSRRAIVFE